jgi:hypothetical protein
MSSATLIESGYPKNKKLPIYEFDDRDVWGNIIFERSGVPALRVAVLNAILPSTGGSLGGVTVHGEPESEMQQLPPL